MQAIYDFMMRKINEKIKITNTYHEYRPHIYLNLLEMNLNEKNTGIYNYQQLLHDIFH